MNQDVKKSRRACYRALKRVFDLVMALGGLCFLLPLFAAIGAAVWVTMGGPVLFTQKRPGQHGIPFHFYKFRTMREAMGPDGKSLSDEQRLTWFGSWLRRTSLDELPQLLNVVKGELSLVGPRPLLMQYLPRYSPEQARRHEAIPGITGWAQVNGRNSLSWKEKFQLDVWYVDHCSFLLDLKILWLTVMVVLGRKGVSNSNHVTMPEFMGNQ